MFLVGLFGLAAFVYSMHQRSREADAFRQAATTLHVPFVSESGLLGGGERSFDGETGGVRFRVHAYMRRSGKNAQRRIRISAHGAPLDLSVRRQGALDDAWQAVAGVDLQIGDPAFDSRAVVKGDPVAARLVLDAGTRAELLQVMEELGARLHDGRVEVDVHRTVTDASWIVERVERLAGLVRRLRADPGDRWPEDRLVAMVEQDPNSGVRRGAFQDLRARAPGRLGPLLDGLVRDKDPGLRALAAGELGDLPTLRRIFAQTEDPEAIVLAAMAVVKHGDAGAESRLLAHAASPNASVRVAVADALGAVGTVRSVETLLPLTQGLLADGDAKAAARAAIAAIQARLGEVEAGRLSVVEDGLSGAVSVATEAGRVSVVKPGGD